MVERYRIVIDVRTERALAYAIMQRGECAIHDLTRRGRVELYRVYQFKLEKDIVEKEGLIEARTVG